MQQVSSVQNSIIKMAASLHQKKNRQKTGLFLIEGRKSVEDALDYGLKITHIFLNKSTGEDMEKLPKNLIYLVNEKVLKKISTTDSPCEILAVAKQTEYKINDLMKDENPLIIILENIKDPGNLGTIIRTAKAAAASGIILTEDTADIFNPKTVRASAANLWKIPIIYLDNTKNLRQKLLKYRDFQFISTVVSYENTKNYFEVNYKTPSVIIFGSEAEGISEGLLDQSDFSVKIPMQAEVESLNLSVSAGIILYEAFLQRRL